VNFITIAFTHFLTILETAFIKKKERFVEKNADIQLDDRRTIAELLLMLM